MGKLDKHLDNLKGTKRRERQQVEKSVQSTVSGSTDALAAKINQGLQALNNASNQSRQKMATLLLQEIAKIVPEISKSHNALIQRVGALETRLAESEQLSRDNVKALLSGSEAAILEKLGLSGAKLEKLVKSVDQVGSSVSSLTFPETDLTGMQQTLETVVQRVDGIKIESTVIPKAKEKWTFTVHRDSEDMITKVTVN